MKQIKRKRKVFSVLTIVMFLASTVWTSFAYADLIPDTDPVAQTIIQQEVTSEETPEVTPEETPKVTPEETPEITSEEVLDQSKDADKCDPDMVKVITFEKIWKYGDGKIITDTSNLPQVEVKIYDENETYIQTLYLKNSEHWKASSKHLDFFKEYHFREAEITGLPEGYKLDEDNSGLIKDSGDIPDFEKTYANKDKCKDKDNIITININYTVTNTIIKEECDRDPLKIVNFEKIWKYKNGGIIAYEDTKDFPEVTIEIYQIKKEDDPWGNSIQSLKLNYSNGWKDKSTPLDVDKIHKFKEVINPDVSGLPQGYMVLGEADIDKISEEEAAEDFYNGNYTIMVTRCNYTVTNTIAKISEVSQRDITVTKVWKDGETVIEDTTNFPEVKARIDFEDESIEDILLTLTKANGWKNGVENIDPELKYDITEEAVTGLQGYTLVGEPEIKEECVPVVSKTDQVQDDNNTKCLYTITNKVNKEVFNFQGTISGLKYNDLDKDGYHDPEEAAVAGFTIDLYDVNPELAQVQPIATAVTNAYGVFSFEVANAGTYYLREALVNGWTQSAPANNVFMVELTAENNKFPESFIENPAYQNVIQKYAKDETAQLFDVAFIFGNYEKADTTSTVIEGHKFSDLNANGAWDEGEPGLQGWTITLWKYMGDMDESGSLTVEDLQNIGTTVTDANGHYEFSDVQPGVTYYLSENITSQIYWTQMYPITGPELSGMGRMNQVVKISAGERVSGINFGNYYYRPSSRSSSGGSSTTTSNVIETFSAGDLNTEPEIRTLSMPVFSSGEDTALEQTLKVNQGIEDSYADSQNIDVDSQTSDANPQTSDPGLTSQFAGLGLSVAAMFALKRRLRR